MHKYARSHIHIHISMHVCMHTHPIDTYLNTYRYTQIIHIYNYINLKNSKLNK